jgi:hypothetical protein
LLKARGKEKRERPKRKVRLGTLAACVILALLVALVIYLILPTQPVTPTKSSKRAAIVDQLSVHFPNQMFINATVDLMQQDGFAVDLFTQDSVTVGLYGTLPSRGYELIVFRVHAGVNQKMTGHPVGLYTTETYNELSYPQEQLADLVAMGRGSDGNDTVVFAVTPKYIEQRSAANYPNTMIVLMGCYGLFSQDLPQAFIDRGASVVIGWDKLVGVDHADKATLTLLRHLLQEKLSVSNSVKATMTEVGPDPDYKSVLGYYPKNNGYVTLSQILSQIIATPLTATGGQLENLDNSSALKAPNYLLLDGYTHTRRRSLIDVCAHQVTHTHPSSVSIPRCQFVCVHAPFDPNHTH